MTVVGSIVVVYDAATSEAIGECKHTSRVNSACFVGGGREGKGEEKEQGEEEGSDGSVVATCSDDKIIRFFKAEGASLMVSLYFSSAAFFSMILSYYIYFVSVLNGYDRAQVFTIILICCTSIL